ncbi:MAG: hypothetical protein GY756_18695 [bacterium]|nr:hypothetical protein [bacterium]
MKSDTDKTNFLFTPIFIITLTIVVIIVYYRSIYYPFLEGWDDQVYVTKNAHISLSLSNIYYWFTHAPPVGGYTPLTMFSFMLDYFAWGFNSMGYHIQNIFWHIVSVIIIFKIFKYLKVSHFFSFILCLIIAVHPQRIESVVWISERKDVLCAAFYFLCIYLYISRYKENKISILTYLLFVCALLSKPMAFSLPFILVLYDFYRTRSLSIKYYIQKYWKFLIILIPYGVVTVLAQTSGIITDKISLLKRLYIIFFNFLWYVKTTIFPVDLSPAYPRVSVSESMYWVIAGYILILTVLIFLLYKYKKTTVFVILPISFAYIISLIPVCGIFLLGVFDHADRFSYIPSAFIWFGIGIFVSCLLRKKTALFVKIPIYILFTVYFIFLVVLNVKYIKSFSSLYEMNKAVCRIEVGTPNPIVLQKLGINEIYHGNYREALKITNRLISLAGSDRLTLREKDSCYLAAGLIRCFAYYYLGKKNETIKIFERIKPFFSLATKADRLQYEKLLSIAADSYESVGKPEKAAILRDEIVKLNKDYTLLQK